MKAYSNIKPNYFEKVEESEIIKAILSRDIIKETSEKGDNYYICEQTKIEVDLGLQKENESKIAKEKLIQ